MRLTLSNIGPIIGPVTGDQRNKTIYFEGGAYVHGRITKAKLNYTKIIGREVLSGRDFKWSERISPSDGSTPNGGVLGVNSFDPGESHIGIGEGNGGNKMDIRDLKKGIYFLKINRGTALTLLIHKP